MGENKYYKSITYLDVPEATDAKVNIGQIAGSAGVGRLGIRDE